MTIANEITADEYLAIMGKGTKSKYGNRKVTLDGYTFDSAAEAQRYRELALMEMNYDIEFLELQPEFELVPAFKRDGRTHRAIRYRADFRYIRRDGVVCVEDVKGAVTAVYALKRKLLLRVLPPDVLFIEVDAGGRRGRRGRR
jgi:hypothetical protein